MSKQQLDQIASLEAHLTKLGEQRSYWMRELSNLRGRTRAVQEEKESQEEQLGTFMGMLGPEEGDWRPEGEEGWPRGEARGVHVAQDGRRDHCRQKRMSIGSRSS